MELKYQCPVCGTPLGYQGLCWKCRAAQDRAEVAAWSPAKIKSLQTQLADNICELEDWSGEAYETFWGLLSGHNAITPEIQRQAVVHQVYAPSAIYYRAPEDVRDQLIAALDQAVYQDTGERQKFCVHGIIGARQTGASNEHEHQTQFS